MRNNLSFILLQGHQERVRNAAAGWSPPKLTAVGNPTLYNRIAPSPAFRGPRRRNPWCTFVATTGGVRGELGGQNFYVVVLTDLGVE